MQRYKRLATGLVAGLAVFLAAGSLPAQDKPNIVVILADDIGPGDIGFYHRQRTGKPEVIPTPNLDRLISRGMRFDDAHSAASLCAPSRFGMLTGSYSYRNYQPFGVWGPWDKTGVDPRFTTSARIAKRAGYATAFFGKSGMGGGFPDVGSGKKLTGPQRYKNYNLRKRSVGPRQLGFDYSFELPSGIQNAPLAFYENDAWYPIKPDSGFTLIGPKQNHYATSRKHQDWKRVGDSHWDPTLAGPMLVEKARAFIERHTSTSPDQPFFLYYCAQAVHIPHTPPRELDGVRIAGSTPGPHGDMVLEMDVVVGMLVKSLQKAGVHDNTLFVFTSDNGGLAPDPAAGRQGHDPTNGWAGLKGAVREGGHRVPFIATWPGVIEPATRSDETISALDVVATIAAVTGQEISRRQVMDSINLLPLLTRAPGAKGHGVVMHYSAKGGAALRQGDWKLHLRGQKLRNLEPKQLFNLKTNPGEDPEKDYLGNPEQRERVEQMLETFRKCLKNPTASL